MPLGKSRYQHLLQYLTLFLLDVKSAPKRFLLETEGKTEGEDDNISEEDQEEDDYADPAADPQRAPATEGVREETRSGRKKRNRLQFIQPQLDISKIGAWVTPKLTKEQEKSPWATMLRSPGFHRYNLL